MANIRRYVTLASFAVLGVFAIAVVSQPFLREPVAPVVHVTVQPEPPVEPLPEPPSEPLTEPVTTPDEATPEEASGAYQTGQRTGEELERLWTQTKDFGKGLWTTLTEKE